MKHPGTCCILSFILAIIGFYFIFWFGSILLNEFKWWQPPTIIIVMVLELFFVLLVKHYGDEFFKK